MRRTVWTCSGLFVVGLLISSTVPARACDKAEGAPAAQFRLSGDPARSEGYAAGHSHDSGHAERLHEHLRQLTERVSMLHAELAELRATMAGIRGGVVATVPTAPPYAVRLNPARRPAVSFAPVQPGMPPLAPMPAMLPMPAPPVAPSFAAVPDFHYVGEFPGGEESGEWHERMRGWQDEWSERSHETADRWREFADEWRVRQQEFAGEWREHQRELTEHWRARHEEFANQWRERQHELQERQEEWQERIHDRARDMAGRIRDNVERVRDDSRRIRGRVLRAERERGDRRWESSAGERERKVKDGKGSRRSKHKAEGRGKKEKRAPQSKRVVYGVTGQQADTLYSLLSPNFVKVVVSHDGDNIAVKGTPKEQKVLNSALQLLGWIDRDEVFERMREGDPVDHRYKLGEKRSERLFSMLAPDSVKVFVSHAGDDAVAISGTKREHKVLRDFLSLIGWSQKRK